jgi:hypothetical protein
VVGLKRMAMTPLIRAFESASLPGMDCNFLHHDPWHFGDGSRHREMMRFRLSSLEM